MKQKKFDWGYFLKHIAIIAIPVALQNLLTTTGSMVDTIMLASIGEKAVGAVGLCAQFSSLMFSGYWGFIGGGMLFFAQYWGAKDHDGITRSYGMTLLFMMTVALVFAGLAIGVPSFIMGVYTDKPEIQAIGISYLRIVGFAYPLQVLSMAMSALLRSIERVKIPLYGGIASVIANCFFNYLFIFGKFGLPEMGAAGAAVGTVLAGVVNLLILIVFILHQRIPFVLEFSKHFRWTKESLQNYLIKCFPIICNEVLIGVGNMMINVVLGRQSEQAIAAVAVFRTMEGLVIAFFSGFSNAASILVGKEVGAGNHELAFERAKRLVYLCSAIISIACLTLLLVHNPLLHMLGLSGKSYETGTGMLIIYSIAAIIRMPEMPLLVQLWRLHSCILWCFHLYIFLIFIFMHHFFSCLRSAILMNRYAILSCSVISTLESGFVLYQMPDLPPFMSLESSTTLKLKVRINHTIKVNFICD